MKTIGIDIGGTQTRIALFSENGLITQVKFPTYIDNPHAQVAQMVAEMRQLSADYLAIGVACPGPLDVKNGVILNPPNLPGWHNFPLQAVLEEASGKPVIIDNDANLAALAEAKIGAGSGKSIVQFLTISTGIGGGLVVNDEIFHGAHGFAQEVANCLVDETNDVPGTTLAGSVERICSGTGIYHLARQKNLHVDSTADVFALANAGNTTAHAIIEYTAQRLASFLATIQGVIDPDIIVIGGSVALHNPEFIQLIENYLKQKVYPTVAPYIQLEIAHCHDAAGVIGAGLWAQHYLKTHGGGQYAWKN